LTVRLELRAVVAKVTTGLQLKISFLYSESQLSEMC